MRPVPPGLPLGQGAARPIIGLPDDSGQHLMRRASARGPVPPIALTGDGMAEDIRRSREAGFTAHLTKPIDFAKLEAMIRPITAT